MKKFYENKNLNYLNIKISDKIIISNNCLLYSLVKNTVISKKK